MLLDKAKNNITESDYDVLMTSREKISALRIEINQIEELLAKKKNQLEQLIVGM
jgi:hypothetical protein